MKMRLKPQFVVWGHMYAHQLSTLALPIAMGVSGCPILPQTLPH